MFGPIEDINKVMEEVGLMINAFITLSGRSQHILVFKVTL
jgi:hypothetical protein